MVKEQGIVLIPANNCKACEYPFHLGDHAMLIVRIPGGEADTLCMDCWLVTVASATAWLGGAEADEPEAIRKRVAEAQERFHRRKRSMGHTAHGPL